MAQLTIQQTFDLAVQRHQAGRLQEAEQLYRQILAQQPAHFDAMHLLGMIAHQTGHNDIAVDLIRRAISLNPNFPEAYSNLGGVLTDKGEFDEAIAAFRQAIALNPNLPGAYNNLGSVLMDKGQFDEAVAAFRQAIAIDPNYAEAHSNLGNALKNKGQADEAIAACRQAISLNPNFPQAHNNLGNALKDKGQFDEAVAAYHDAIALNPHFPEAHNNLGNALAAQRQLDEAIAVYRKAIVLKPNYAEAHNNLGNALKDKGQLDEAIASYRHAIALNPNFPEGHHSLGNALIGKAQLDEAIIAFRQAIALRPNYVEAHNNLGIALNGKGQLDEAIAAFRQAIALNPKFPEAPGNLGIVLKDKGQLDEAVAACRQAIALNPNFPEAHHNLGNALAARGQFDEAIAAYRQAILLVPDFSTAHSNLLFTMHYHPGYDAQAIAEEHRDWGHRHADPLRIFHPIYSNDPASGRPLRIGYVSPDFRRHSVGYLALPLLENHDRTNFQIFCYASVRNPDVMTERFKRACNVWRNIAGLSDQEAADLIRSDGIDILVDLSGHTSGNRLLIFARKPAPIQATYLGYPNTTGMTAIDYRLSDALADPLGMTDPFTVEKLWRLPTCAWCYQPTDEMPEITSRPAGPIVFGCLNNFSKVNPADLEVWAKVLVNNPGSRMLLLAPHGESRQPVLKTFEILGVDPARIELIDRLERQAYLQAFNRIDVSLDTYPYHGTVTTCESLWMGVPAVSLAGRTHVSRVGVSLLTHAGLDDLVAESTEQYVRLATELAHDENRLTQLRLTLRDKMRQSPLMDAKRYALEIENAYRQMWRIGCETAFAKS